MSGTVERLAAELAEDVLRAQDELGQERLFTEVAGMLATSSQSLEEAFLTEIRIRLAERQARALLNRKLSGG